MGTVEQLYFSKREVATMLGVCRNTVESLIRKRDLEIIHVGKVVRIHKHAIEKYLKRAAA